MKKFWKKYKVGIIVVVMLGVFIGLSLLIESGEKTSKERIDLEKVSENIRAWIDLTENDQYVVTVLAQTGCTACMSFEPTVEKLQEEHNVTLFWFEIDELYEANSEDYKAVTEYYKLKQFNGTPHTYITAGGKLLDEIGAAISYEKLVDFLKDNGVIK